ncbi:uncharacterized protein LOC126708093 [Quercus robur]|uniref:uncharacterized protein LOC126708093 n=1 Tax=Quercus robur TaxID=38942 RepID=UPI002161A54B|nr:uncharacterized protein LOC126708093 [Quercus robur]
MMDSVANYGKGLKLPTYHETRLTFLKKEVENMHFTLDKYKNEWKKTGCTLMSDGWTDNRERSITNFLVNSPKGTVFLKSIDTSNISKNAENLFQLLDSLVQEIGEENVVQVVTDSASAYVSAGEKLMEKRRKIFWNPCAAHCIDLMLHDIGDLPVHANTIKKAKKITVFIYRHIWVLDLMRKYTKTRELARQGVTRFSTAYLTLKSIYQQKIGLRSMFASEEWAKSPYAKKSDGINVQLIVLSDPKFWPAIKFCLKCVIPLVKVLRLVDGDAKPAMGYIYEAMDRAKEQIRKNFNDVQRRYRPILRIIETRWELQLHRPLHAAAYFLNPKFHYDPNFVANEEVRVGLYEVIERMCPTTLERCRIDLQLEKFDKAEGLFGKEMAILTRTKKQPDPHAFHRHFHLINRKDLETVLKVAVFVNEEDGQVRAVHKIVGYDPIQKSFAAPKHVIRANDPRLQKITVVEHGFLISEGSPVPEGIPLAGSSPSHQAAEDEGDLGLSEEGFGVFD